VKLRLARVAVGAGKHASLATMCLARTKTDPAQEHRAADRGAKLTVSKDI
jgi:hypothetical protein